MEGASHLTTVGNPDGEVRRIRVYYEFGAMGGKWIRIGCKYPTMPATGAVNKNGMRIARIYIHQRGLFTFARDGRQ